MFTWFSFGSLIIWTCFRLEKNIFVSVMFLTMYSYCNSCFLKKDCSYKFNCGIRLQDGDVEHSLMKEKNRCPYILLPIFMFNLKDTNSCMFSWCITTGSLLICSWHDMTLSHLYSIYSKSLLFASISYVQESFKLNQGC